MTLNFCFKCIFTLSGNSAFFWDGDYSVGALVWEEDSGDGTRDGAQRKAGPGGAAPANKHTRGGASEAEDQWTDTPWQSLISPAKLRLFTYLLYTSINRLAWFTAGSKMREWEKCQILMGQVNPKHKILYIFFLLPAVFHYLDFGVFVCFSPEIILKMIHRPCDYFTVHYN